MDNKKYYYLKLKDNFFDRPEIRAIESLESGYEYICIMQKMYLRSLCREGKLMLTDNIPYDLKTLSKVLGHKQETIAAAIKLFLDFELCEILDNKAIYMNNIHNFIGQSSTEADRIRKYRAKIDNEKQEKTLQIPYKCTPELELEIEREIESQKATNVTPKKTRSKTFKQSISGKAKYGEFVYLFEQEYKTLIEHHGKKAVDEMIDNMNNYLGVNGDPEKYKNHFFALRNWFKRDKKGEQGGIEEFKTCPVCHQYLDDKGKCSRCSA